MREFRTYGSVRGALSNERPYRDRPGMTLKALCKSFNLAQMGTSRGMTNRRIFNAKSGILTTNQI
jgi:hypothetical protein